MESETNRQFRSLIAFLQKAPHMTSERLVNGRTVLFDHYKPQLSNKQSTASRINIARKNLRDIQKEFGDAVYYLCLFGCPIAFLGTHFLTSNLDKYLRDWAGKTAIEADFVERARTLIEDHKAKGEPIETTSQKRPISPPRSTHDGENPRKRARSNDDLDVMSVDRVIERAESEISITRSDQRTSALNNNLQHRSKEVQASTTTEVNLELPYVGSIEGTVEVQGNNGISTTVNYSDKEEEIPIPVQEKDTGNQSYPLDPMVISPLISSGKYAGRIRLVVPGRGKGPPFISIQCDEKDPIDILKLQNDLIMLYSATVHPQ